MKTPEHEERCDAIRDGYVVPLSAGQDRDRINLDRNVIDRIVTKAGSEQLTLRERMLEEFESGKMEPENELEGQTVSIQVDAGRTRTRSELKSISPLENFGKTQSEIDGSFGDADYLERLIAIVNPTRQKRRMARTLGTRSALCHRFVNPTCQKRTRDSHPWKPDEFLHVN